MPHESVITTSNGAPVDDNQNSISVGPYGPVVIGDFHLIDKLAHFDRERIPERVVHAKGAGAYGYFEVTNDITKYCKAKLFERVGKRTEVFVRFSTVGGEKGSADTARDPRGFAVKFYTEEGNWDMVGNNTPIFFIRDAIKFPDFIHTQKKHPQTNLPNADMFWDFLSLVPESVHQVTILFSDRGTPDGYTHMNGYSSHTFKFINDHDEMFYVKLHFKTQQKIKNLTDEKAKQLAAEDPDYATRDLFNKIAKKEFPSWKLYAQIMEPSKANNFKFNIFDITKVWPHADFPLIPIGVMTLNKNPDNYFAEVEQAAFAPSHLVPGIEPSEDKVLQGRLFSYTDTHRHRIGGNYDQIPVNSTKFAVRNDYSNRDGYMNVNGNKSNKPNYEPNSVDSSLKAEPKFAYHKFKAQGIVKRHQPNHPNDDFVQAGVLYRNVMNDSERDALIKNICGHLCNAREEIQQRMVAIFSKCDSNYGKRVAEGLGLRYNSHGTSKM